MRASSTFVPGPSDPRALGVMLDSLTLAPNRIVLPPRRALTGVALASAALGAAVALLGVTPATAVGTALLLSAALAALVARGFGPYTDFADVVARTTIWTGGVTTLLAAGVARVRGEPFRNTAKFAIAFTAAAFLLELLALLHPDMPIGDALFHAHRFQDVLGGRYYFTSVAPGNYQFPYAPGLYVFAIPFAGLVRRGVADMTVLRTIVCAADALAGLLLYAMAVRVRGDRLSGALAVALYHLIPLGFGVMVVGNLTNAFAQSISVAALALMASAAVRVEHRATVAGLAAVLAAAFLSHTGTFAIGSVAACVIAFLFWWRGGPALRSPAAAVLLAAVAAVVLAVVVYYAHFIDTYRTELARIGGETAAAAPDAGGRGIGDRLASVPRYLQLVLRRPGTRPRRLGCGAPLGAGRARSHDARHDGMAADLRPVSRARHPHTGRHAVLPGRGSRAGDLCGRREQHRLDIGRPLAHRRRRAARRNGFRRSPRVVEYAWGIDGYGSGSAAQEEHSNSMRIR